MTHGKFFLVLSLLTINLLACKNEPAATGDATPPPPPPPAAASQPDSAQQMASVTTQVAAPATAKPISYIVKEKILLKDNTEILLPKAGDKEQITFYFATPGAKAQGMTSLSQEGQMQANRLTGVMAKAGLDIIWAEGNAGMQTGLGAAKANASEYNLIKAEDATETLKTIVHNYMGKKVMIVAGPAVISDLMIQLVGKPVVTVPSNFSPVLYLVTARSMGDKYAQVTEMSY